MKNFLDKVCDYKPDHNVIDIHGSYHLGKQHVDDYIEKMLILQQYVGFGAVSMSAELINKTTETIVEYRDLVNALPTGKVFFRNTIVNDPKSIFTNGDAGRGRLLPPGEFERYKQLIDEDPEYYIGKDEGSAIEYRYMMRHHPELAHMYLPFGFICPPSDFISNNRWRNLYVTKTYNVMIGLTHASRKYYKKTEKLKDILPDLYKHTLDVYHEQQSGCVQNVKYMKCNSGRKGMEIAHDMRVHHCHEQTPFDPPDKNPTTTIDKIDMSTWLSKDIMCMAAECICGMDWRWKNFDNLPKNIQQQRQKLNKHWFNK